MKKINSGWLLITLVIILFSGFGCASIRKEKAIPVPISEIQGHPREWVGKTVQVSGEVKEAFSLVLYKYFIVKDKTGEIRVVTSKPLPRKGEQIRVEGKVEEGFAIGSDPQTVIKEKG
ncbi:MAG: hypothetical protein LLH30_09445 [Candidatus Manganitrophus sp. SA1]|nr:hypothetical protein [Candidatus Manganitrophus morganii]MCG3115888.1 hypothetical protein [Candidatus Manganitrophus morganii]